MERKASHSTSHLCLPARLAVCVRGCVCACMFVCVYKDGDLKIKIK